MLKIGLTGGIASGKSTVLDFFKKKNVPYIDADVVAREVVEIGTPGLVAIHQLFGDTVLRADGSLNREALGAIVFHNETKLLELNNCLHGLIRERIDELTNTFERQHEPVVIYDIPLLIEGKWYERLDTVWLVYVSPEVQVQRLMARNGYSKEDALARIQSQMLLDDKRPYADVIINNDGTPDELYIQLEKLWHEKLLPLYNK